jgi:hypothetical protein
MDFSAAGVGWGVAFMVSAGAAAEFIAKACSSPQTLQVNAKTRAPTLMKWVNLGALEAALFVGIAAYVDKAHRVPILLGGGIEIAITYAEYLHAREQGLKSSAPGTEDTGGGGGSRPAAPGAGWGWAT